MRALAEVNVAIMRAAVDDPAMAGFAAAFDPVNRLAEQCPGFIWRLRSGSGHPVVAADNAGHVVVNVSIWRDYRALHEFVYRSGHGAYLRHRSRWFLPGAQPSTALWWVAVDVDTHPSVEQALRRLSLLRRYGPTPDAFSLRRQFDQDGRPISRVAP